MGANYGYSYNVYFINDELLWGYQIFDKTYLETYRRNYGFKSMEDAEESVKKEIKIMEEKHERQCSEPGD